MARRRLAAAVILTALAAAGAGKPRAAFEDILAKYTFVADFGIKPEEREVSDEIFWRYPYKIPKVEFPIYENLDDPKIELPATKGGGRAVDHLNRGRVSYLEGRYADAKGAWLGARARFGTTYPFHRRNDYFIGLAFLQLAREELKAKGSYDAQEVKGIYSNAATFLSWAFIMKQDVQDPLIDQVTPKGLYNLAATYWTYNRFAGAYGAAEVGLNFLRKTGRKEFRPQFQRFVAEAHVQNRSYLDAVQALDMAIRQDPDPKQAAAAFARAGDIYFDLNNYDLAEEAYGLGAKIDEEQREINPAQLVLRGESLFWLGKFSEAQKILHFARRGAAYRDVKVALPPEYAGWAALRIADAFLARKEFDKAKLEYYKVRHEFRSALPGRIARVREACLELPYYQGHNVDHARELLEEAKKEGEIPRVAQELAWACQVGSYTDRERTPEMLSRVKDFAAAYPESGFLKTFVEPVREFQASHIEGFFKAGETYKALSFFEKNRKTLFPKVDEELQRRLFVAYADVFKSDAAKEFWAAYAKAPDSDLKLLRQAAVLAELKDKRVPELQKQMRKRDWTLDAEPLAVAYVRRLRLSAFADGYLPGLLPLVQKWGDKEATYRCDLEYPILSRLRALGKDNVKVVDARVDQLLGKMLPELFKHDESCALSLLELEAARLRGEPKTLADRYLARKDWPLVGGYLHLYWTMAEHVLDAGDRDSARKMWEEIRERGPQGAPEVGFAKARLDPTKTEFEKLWN